VVLQQVPASAFDSAGDLFGPLAEEPQGVPELLCPSEGLEMLLGLKDLSEPDSERLAARAVQQQRPAEQARLEQCGCERVGARGEDGGRRPRLRRRTAQLESVFGKQLDVF